MSEQRKKRQSPSFRSRNGGMEGHSKNFHSKNKSNSHSQKSNFQRQTSYDSVRKIVQAEGRTARNLVTWSVPVEDDEKGQRSQQGSPRKTPRTRSVSNSSTKGKKSRDRTISPGAKKSPGSDPNIEPPGTPKQTAVRDFRARWWAFLFDNLRRAVDEIYNTCEQDESVVECKEAIMMLEQSTRDFQALIERLQLLRAYENADETNRPRSLAWDVRKTSPGKALSNSQNKEFFVPSPTVSRSLNFGTQTDKPVGCSWAERVKNSPKVNIAPLTSSENIDTSKQENSEPVIEDMDGWETVHKGRHGKLRRSHSGSLNKSGMSSPASSHKGSPRPSPAPHDKRSQQPSFRRGSQPAKPKHNNKPNKANTPQPDNQQNRQRASSIDSEKENKETSYSEALKSKLARSMPDIKQDAAPVFVEDKEILNGDKGDVDEVTSSLDADVEAYQAQLENALASALDAEESLDQQLEEENEAAIQAAENEEENYLKQIAHEQNTDIDIETETETEAESDLGTTAGSGTLESSTQPLDWDSMIKQHELDQKANLSWGDMAEEDEVNTRTPGRSVRVHEKLSSPSRKRYSRSATETRKKYEEKQAKAEVLRNKVMTERAERIKLLTSKVAEVRQYKEELLNDRRDFMSAKLAMAEERRQGMLRKTVRKAHEEEAKANEIAFINSMEAQHKKHELIQKQQELEARLQDREEERRKKFEEEAAKKAAVEARRKILEAEKEARLQEMLSKRHEKEKTIELRQQEKEKERIEQKRAKEKEFEERMAAINAQEAQRKEVLQRNIKHKLDESEKRKKENIAQIKEKAFEMSILRHSTDDHNDAPTSVPYETKKLCSVCNVMISSEVYLLSHLRGKKHQQALRESKNGSELTKHDIERFNLKHISDAPKDKPDPQIVNDKERQKALKKRCKKLRTRMAQRGAEYENSLSNKQQTVESDHRAKFQKVVKDLNKYASSQDKGPWPQNRVSALDRALGELMRILEKKIPADQGAFRVCGGLTTLTRLLLVINDASSDLPVVIPTKSLVHTCNVYRLACRACYDNCHYMLFSNKIGCLVDLLSYQLQMLIPDNFNSMVNPSLSGSGNASTILIKLPHDPIASALLQLLVSVLSCLARNHPAMQASDASAERMSNSGRDTFSTRANDIVSYIVSVGVIDKLSVYLDNVRGPLDDNAGAAEFVQHGLGLLIGVTKLLAKRSANIFETAKKKTEDPTQLVATFEVTDLCGIVSLMYGVLLHSGSPARSDATPPELPVQTLTILTSGFKMLNQLATLDLPLLQSTLGCEGMSLEFRHIASNLLWYCNKLPNEELLHEVILCVGYFTVLHPDNQNVIQSGQPPSVLQQLCQLPFQYFSDPRLTNVLFPTLIASCYQCQGNRVILEQELSPALLANFIEEKSLELQQSKSPTSSKKGKTSEKEGDSRMLFASRFPQEKWESVQENFKAS